MHPESGCEQKPVTLFKKRGRERERARWREREINMAREDERG